MPRHRFFSVAIAALGLAGFVALAGCGSDTVTTENRPPRSIEVSVRIGPKGVEVSPKYFGSGLANFTIANLTEFPTSLAIEGPVAIRGTEIQPGGSENLQGDLEEGLYRALANTSSGLQGFNFTVGPPRGDSNQELLLP